MNSMVGKANNRFGPSWLDSQLGRYVQAQEQKLFDAAVADIFGFNALQLGVPQADFLQNARIPYLLKVGREATGVSCDYEQLPFANSSIDLLVMPHVLDFSQYPQQALREAERVLLPEGHIVLTGFNQISPWGLRRLLSRRCASSSSLWHAHFFSASRIKDWLNLLGFEVVATQMACHQLPFQTNRWLQRFHMFEKMGRHCWPMFGAVYCIVAKKRVLGMRVIKPNWKAAKVRARFAATSSQKEEALEVNRKQ